MKILFINVPKSDYLQDGLYTGLVKRLGAANVVDYPFNPRFHLNIKTYPKNTGYAARTLLPRLVNALRSDLKHYGAIIVGSSAPAAIERYLELRPKIPPHVPTVFLDGGDREEIGGDLLRAGRKDLHDAIFTSGPPFDLIFKREMLIDKDYAANVYPMPFCFNLDVLPKALQGDGAGATVKNYDVSFWAVESHPIRSQALDILQNQFDCRSNGTERHQVFKKYKRKGAFYLEELKRCKIVLNFRGGGWDTLRYWEVPAVQTFMLSQKPGIRIENNFVDGRHAAFVQNNLSDLTEKCRYYLENESERETMAAAGYNHLVNYHLDIHRADDLLMKL